MSRPQSKVIKMPKGIMHRSPSTKKASKSVKAPKEEPSAISQGYKKYEQILKTIGELYSYKYGERRKLASTIYRSGVDPTSLSEVMKAEEISKRPKPKREPRTLSQETRNYHKVLRTIRELYPYSYRDAQQLASTIYRSGADSEIEIMKEESRIRDVDTENY